MKEYVPGLINKKGTLIARLSCSMRDLSEREFFFYLCYLCSMCYQLIIQVVIKYSAIA